MPEEKPPPSLEETVAAAIETENAKLEPPVETEATVDETQKPAESKETKVRDDHGRFVKGAKREESKVAEEAAKTVRGEGTSAAEKAEEGSTEEPPKPKLKPPAGWKALAKEQWAKLPAEVQQEVLRREGDNERLAKDSSAARGHFDAFQARLERPYDGFFRSQGFPDSIAGLEALAQGFHRLNTGPMQTRVEILASLIQGSIGVNTDTMTALAQVLEAMAPGQGGLRQAPPFDPVAFKQQLFQEWQQTQVQQQDQMDMQLAEQDRAAFEATEPEFYNEDIKLLMATIMESDANTKLRLPVGDPRRVALSWEEAYRRACLMDQETAEVLRQREEAKAATSRNDNAQRARIAAGSLKSDAPTAAERDLSLDAVVERAYDEQMRRLGS